MLCKCSGKYIDIYFILKITYFHTPNCIFMANVLTSLYVRSTALAGVSKISMSSVVISKCKCGRYRSLWRWSMLNFVPGARDVIALGMTLDKCRK